MLMNPKWTWRRLKSIGPTDAKDCDTLSLEQQHLSLRLSSEIVTSLIAFDEQAHGTNYGLRFLLIKRGERKGQEC